MGRGAAAVVGPDGMRIRCRVPDCSQFAKGLAARPFCGYHWSLTPDDLKERLRFTLDEQDRRGYDAALHAIIQVVQEGHA